MSAARAWELAGHLHPFLVHFPVALVFLSVAAEVLLVVRKEARFGDAGRFMIAAAAWISIPAAIAGFALASGQTFTDEEVRIFAIHRIAGITTPVLIFLAAGMAASARRSGQIWELFLFRIFLALAVVSVAIAGVQGGQLVWGDGYFGF